MMVRLTDENVLRRFREMKEQISGVLAKSQLIMLRLVGCRAAVPSL